jgi:hypothetical protein
VPVRQYCVYSASSTGTEFQGEKFTTTVNTSGTDNAKCMSQQQQPTVTNPQALQSKSLAIQVVLTIISLGIIYPIYWFYSTAKQLDQGTDQSLIPILAIIPFINLIVVWQISSASEAVTNQSKIVVFLLFIFFPPLSWYWVQSGMNGSAQG